jgi:hypothetical protein
MMALLGVMLVLAQQMQALLPRMARAMRAQSSPAAGSRPLRV